MRSRKRSHNTPLVLLALGSLAVLASLSGGTSSARPVDAATVAARAPVVAAGAAGVQAIRSVDFAEVAQPGSSCEEGLRFSPPGSIPVSQGASQVLDLASLTQLSVDPQVAYADITGDGTEDAVVHVVCSFGANGREDSVHVWSIDGNRLVHVADVEEPPSDVSGGFPASVQSIGASDGSFEVTWSHYAEDDPNCCPSEVTELTYELDDDTLSVTGDPVTRPAQP